MPRAIGPTIVLIVSLCCQLSSVSPRCLAGDRPQWGEAWGRNQMSSERGLPTVPDPKDEELVLWKAQLGTEAHSTPVIADGRVYIGTNNAHPRDLKHQGDRGVLMCLDEKTGALNWQLVVPKRSEDPYFDWPKSGISSPATVEGDRVYIVSNRGEVICLDAKGLADGNDGPFVSEGEHMTAPASAREPVAPRQGALIEPEKLQPEKPILTPGSFDADIIWIHDLVEESGIWPHDGAHSSILIHGNHLYLNSGTGVDNTHKRIRRPEAPSLVVLDKHTGRLLARDREGIGPNIFHSTWSAPSMGTVEGNHLLFFGAGNGIVYAFSPLAHEVAPEQIVALERVWRHDFDPTAPKAHVHRFHQNKRIGPSNFYGMPVFHEQSVYIAGGGDLWWGKNQAWLKNLDARTGEEKWSAELGRHVFSTPAIWNGLVFQADNSRFVYCFDAVTGALHWKHEARGDFWASPLVADGKVYLGSRRGDFWVFAAEPQLNILAEIDFGAPISATAVASNQTLYIATMFDLCAFRK